MAVKFPKCAAPYIAAAVGVVLHAESFGAMQPSQRVPRPNVALQPLAQQARRLETTLSYLGQPLAPADHRLIDDALAVADEEEGVQQIQTALDKYVLAVVRINPESRVKVEEGAAKPELVEGGTRLFLVKVINHGNVRAPLSCRVRTAATCTSAPTGIPRRPSSYSPQESKERWANISLYQRPPMRPRLSGLALEYAILEVYSRDAGQRSAKISFNVGQGSQDIGFRNDVTVLFTALPARRITLRVKDEKGRPTMASFIHQRPPRPHLPAALQAPRARLFLPAADLSRRRRIGAASQRATTPSSTPAGPST